MLNKQKYMEVLSKSKDHAYFFATTIIANNQWHPASKYTPSLCRQSDLEVDIDNFLTLYIFSFQK